MAEPPTSALEAEQKRALCSCHEWEADEKERSVKEIFRNISA